MKTRYEQMTSSGLDGYSNFIGDDSDYRDWYGVIGQSRDSTALERSNFKIALERLGGESDTVIVARYGHWAVGWIDEIYVKPNTPECAVAEQIEKELSNYSILDEIDFSDEEQIEADEIWANCYDWRERIEYIREHSSEFEFKTFLDMLACVRGKYFAGYAGEFIN